MSEGIIILRSIKYSKSYKNVTDKYNINHPFMQRKLEAVLSPFGIKKYVDAKKFLDHQDINDIFKKLENSGHIEKIIDLGHFRS